MRWWSALLLVVLFPNTVIAVEATASQQRHHKHNHRRHRRHRAHHSNRTGAALRPQIAKTHAVNTTAGPDRQHAVATVQRRAEGPGSPKLVVEIEKSLVVNGPLPSDFAKLFARAVAEATNSNPDRIKVVEANHKADGTVHLIYQAPIDVAKSTQEQAADPDSRLANGKLHDFLVAQEVPHEDPVPRDTPRGEPETAREEPETAREEPETADAMGPPTSRADLPMQRGLDMDTEMPYGELEPFGREDTAQELTEQSISESNEMVDQLERAEVAEEQRAVFRALTRLRGAAISAFDGIARVQTGTIDEYNKFHKWRQAHPLHHLADEESDVSKWAFPDF